MRAILFTFILLTSAAFAAGQNPVVVQNPAKGYFNIGKEIIQGDTIQVVNALPIYVFNNPADLADYQKLVRNLKIVYPIAKRANQLLQTMETRLTTLDAKADRKDYIKGMEAQLQKEYTPILKQMTYSQGKLLIKLINRETNNTAYDLVKELRGSFQAFFWQTTARLFGSNLKDTYDKDGEDNVIEQLILLYDAGLL